MIHRCSTLGLSAVLKPAKFRFCSWACSCWWLVFSAEVTYWGTKPCSPCSLTWETCNKERWREGSGSLHLVGRRFGSLGVRCDVAQVTIYFPRHGRVGAPGHHYGVCRGLCSVAWGGKLCWAPVRLLAQLCFGLWCQVLKGLVKTWSCLGVCHECACSQVPGPFPNHLWELWYPKRGCLLINCKCFPIQDTPM